MLELNNQTKLRAGLYPGYGRERALQMTCVIKASYAIDPQGRLTPKAAAPIEETDCHAGDPVKTALLKAGECVPYKEGAEFYLFGTATPPAADARVMEVTVSLASNDGKILSKKLRLFGPRVWSGMRLFPRVSDPQPLARLPIAYEHAFGGIDPFPRAGESDPYPQNWIGKGYIKNTKKCVGLALPQIEYADRLIASPEDRPAPAGFGPLSAFWSPRLEAQGSLDQTKTQSVGCILDADAAASAYNYAPLDQRLAKPFQGGETLTLRSLLPGVPYDQAVNLVLPALAPELVLVLGGKQQALQAVCDTLVIDADRKELSLIARAGIPWKMSDRRPGWVIVREPITQATAAPALRRKGVAS